jgi:hypothetical protein
MYSHGRGMPADRIGALFWNALAVKQNQQNAIAAKPEMEAKATPEQRREAEKLAAKFKPKQ